MEYREHSKIQNKQFATVPSYHSFLRVGGPSPGTVDTIYDPNKKQIFSAKTFSTFPKVDSIVSANPCSHRYYCAYYSHKILFALADGGSGNLAAEAAERAILGFVDYMNSIQKSLETTREAAHGLQRGFSKAHEYISRGKNEAQNCGTAQLLGGLLVELEESEGENTWAFICCSVGHCKAFYIHNQNNKIVDITQNNYLYRSDVPLGRLGPCIEGGLPDLTNLRLYYYPVKPGDTILFATPGAHANLHPQQLGLKTQSIKATCSEWKELSSNEEGRSNLVQFYADKLQACFGPKKLDPSELLNKLEEYNVQVTESARTHIEEAQIQSLDKLNRTIFPAILDNATSFVIIPSRLNISKQIESNLLASPATFTPRKWQWKVFIPHRNDAFDIWKYLITLNPLMEETINALEEKQLEEVYINVNDSDIELQQVNPKSISVRVRTRSKHGTGAEKWEIAGEITLESKQPITKKLLCLSLSNLLRQKEVDRRKVVEVVEYLQSLTPATDVFVIQGTKKVLSLEKFGSSFKIISGDMVLEQSDVTITSMNGESKGKFRCVEISANKESCVTAFVANFVPGSDWITSSIPEFIQPSVNL